MSILKLGLTLVSVVEQGKSADSGIGKFPDNEADHALVVMYRQG